MGVEDVPDRTSEEQRQYWRAWDRLTRLRRRHSWLRRAPTLIQWAAVMISFRLEKRERQFLRKHLGADEDGS